MAASTLDARQQPPGRRTEDDEFAVAVRWYDYLRNSDGSDDDGAPHDDGFCGAMDDLVICGPPPVANSVFDVHVLRTWLGDANGERDALVRELAAREGEQTGRWSLVVPSELRQ